MTEESQSDTTSSSTNSVRLTLTPSHPLVFSFDYEVQDGETPNEAKERVRVEGSCYEEADIALTETSVSWAEVDPEFQENTPVPLYVGRSDAHAVIDTLEHHGFNVTEEDHGYVISMEDN